MGNHTVAFGIPITTITETNIVPGTYFHDVATDGTNLYIAGGESSIYSVSITGGTVQKLYTSRTPLSVVVVGNDLYWIDANSGPVTDTQIFKAPTAGGGPATAIYTGSSVGQPIVDGSGIATDGTKLYTADMYNGKVHSLNFDGSGITQIDPERYTGGFSTHHHNSIASTGGKVFIGESAADYAGHPRPGTPGIYTHSSSVTTGSFDTLYSGAPFGGLGIRGIEVWGDTVYVTQGDTI